MINHDPSAELKAENARLIALLEANGIQWRTPPETVPPASTPEPPRLSTDAKVALFRRLFRGRTDVYPIRWEAAILIMENPGKDKPLDKCPPLRYNSMGEP